MKKFTSLGAEGIWLAARNRDPSDLHINNDAPGTGMYLLCSRPLAFEDKAQNLRNPLFIAIGALQHFAVILSAAYGYFPLGGWHRDP